MKIRLHAAAAVVAVAAISVACVPGPPPPTTTTTTTTTTSTTTTTTAPDPWAPPQCWESLDPFTAALAYFGPENTLNNASFASRNTNCSFVFTNFPETVVRAPDQAAADALCGSIAGKIASKLTTEVVNPPADGWRCF